MTTSKTWPGGATGATPTAYPIPTAGEFNWPALTNFLTALADGAQCTTFQKYSIRVATSTPVTIATTDCIVVCDLTVPGAVTVNLPAGANKQVFYIIDGKGDANTNNITINPNGAETIAGSATLVLSGSREGTSLAYNSADTDFKIISRFNRAGSAIGGFTASRAIVSDGSGNLAAATTTSAEVGYVNGVTSAIQTQLDNKQPLDADLTALAALASNGLIARTGAGTVSARTVTGTANKITVADGDGVAGNPTLNVGTDIVVLTGAQILTDKTLTAPILTTPQLGTPASGILTSCTGLPIDGGTINTLPVARGGTAVTSVTTAPTASSFAGWDANSNLSANSFIDGYATTATSATTTTLLVGSKHIQYFTGVTTQTVVLPVTSTLVLGQQFVINNLSSGNVTVQSSGANSIQVMGQNSQLVVTCILTSGTDAASWNAVYSSATGGTVTSVAASVPSVFSISGSPITTSGTLAMTYSGTALPVANGGTGVTGSTGSVAVVLSNTPTLVTPVLGAATGTSVALGAALQENTLMSAAASATNCGFFGMFSANGSAATTIFAKSRNATPGSHTIVQSGDEIGFIPFRGSNGTTFDNAAAIRSVVDGTPGASADMPGRIQFETCANGSATLTERMRIDNAGRVTINDASNDGLTRLRLVTAGPSVDAQGVLLTDTDTGVDATNLILGCQFNADNDCTGGRFIGFFDSGGQIGRIEAASATGVAYQVTSDERLKCDFEEFNGLELVNQLRPVKFKWLEKSSKYPEVAEHGFIAQQVHKVLPKMVSKGGEDPHKNPWCMDYGKLTGVLTQAIKELLQRVEVLEKRLGE